MRYTVWMKWLICFSFLLTAFPVYACGDGGVSDNLYKLLILFWAFLLPTIYSVFKLRSNKENAKKGSGWIIGKSLKKGLIWFLVALALIIPTFIIRPLC